jgi:ankyrin repeat protein
MGELRREVWRITGVPWCDDVIYGGQCQVLMLRGDRMPTDDRASVSGIGLADGDVVQLVDDISVLKRGCTYLHVGARYAVREAVRVLVEAADGSVDAMTDFQYTALHVAACNGHAGVVEDLVGVAADCHAWDSDVSTPLHDAAEYDYEDAVRALGCGGADLHATNPYGSRPVDVAKGRSKKRLKTIEMRKRC